MNEITLLLVDDEPLVRRGLRMRLELEPDVRIVGEAGDGPTAVRMAAELAPSVVIMDVELPIMDGIAAAREIVAHRSATVVVMLSMHDDAATVQRALEAGAADFVSKDCLDGTLLAAIRRLAQGEGRPVYDDNSSAATNDQRDETRR